MMVWLLPPPLGAGRVHEEHWGGLAPTGLSQPLLSCLHCALGGSLLS